MNECNPFSERLKMGSILCDIDPCQKNLYTEGTPRTVDFNCILVDIIQESNTVFDILRL